MSRINVIASQGSNKLEGVADLKANLALLSDEVATKGGRLADRRAAQAFAAALRLTAPYSTGVQSKASRTYGHLRDNIRVKLAKSRTENTIVYNVDMRRAFWSFFQEFGTRHQSANPFMRRAFDGSVQRLQEVQIAELRTATDKAIKKMTVTPR